MCMFGGGAGGPSGARNTVIDPHYVTDDGEHVTAKSEEERKRFLSLGYKPKRRTVLGGNGEGPSMGGGMGSSANGADAGTDGSGGASGAGSAFA